MQLNTKYRLRKLSSRVIVGNLPSKFTDSETCVFSTKAFVRCVMICQN